MSQDELAVMDGGKCILQLRGVRPFLSDKYDITRHPNFKYTADADKRNTFDIEAFLSARLKLKPDEVCDVYDLPQLPLLRPLAYKAGNHQQNNEKGGQPESGSHISRADCSGFCALMKQT